MAFDGVTVACLTKELSQILQDTRILKISQTESDELILTCKTAAERGGKGTVRLMLSASAQLPLICLVEENRPAPMQAPAFCMLLRKHLENGRILSVTQPSLERVVHIDISHYDEMGDLKTRRLVIELMGKHSNIILTGDDDVILDAIKHVPASMSSVREVLPGRTYFLPDTRHKHNPFLIQDAVMLREIFRAPAVPDHVRADDAKEKDTRRDVHGMLVSGLTGISPVMAAELCFRAQLDPATHVSALDAAMLNQLSDALTDLMQTVSGGDFSPRIYYKDKEAAEFSAVPLLSLEARNLRAVKCESMSRLLLSFYAQKQVRARMQNKSADLRQLVQTLLARTVRKYDQQLQQLKDTEKKELYRLRGELLTAYAHEVTDGMKEVTLTDYHSGKPVRIPLDEHLSATENAQKQFDRYARMKRTQQTLEVLTKEVALEIEQLKSIRLSLDMATDEAELSQIRTELIESGFLKEKRADRAKQKGAHGKDKAGGKKGPAREEKSSPLHYLTSDGFHVYVGKNNYQNDALTFQNRAKDDWWFHAKKIPGSHVVLRGKGEAIPDRAFEEAAALAAYYSTGREAGKAEVDYTELKNVKKPAKAKPGFVVYDTNYSLMAVADISALTPL